MFEIMVFCVYDGTTQGLHDVITDTFRFRVSLIIEHRFKTHFVIVYRNAFEWFLSFAAPSKLYITLFMSTTFLIYGNIFILRYFDVISYKNHVTGVKKCTMIDQWISEDMNDYNSTKQRYLMSVVWYRSIKN